MDLATFRARDPGEICRNSKGPERQNSKGEKLFRIDNSCFGPLLRAGVNESRNKRIKLKKDFNHLENNSYHSCQLEITL